MVAAPVDLRTKKAERFSPQARQGFWSKIEIKNPKIVVMPPTVFTKYNNQKEVTWQQDRLCLAIVEHKILGGEHFSYFSTRITKIWWLKKVQYLQKKYHCQWTILRRKQLKWIFHNFGDLLQPLDLVPASRERMVPTEGQVRTVLGDCISRARVIPVQAPQYRQFALISDFLDCKPEYTRGSSIGNELDQGPT